MEITINIPKNDYVQPKEVREEVVQAICDAFLESHCNSIFHPYGSGCCRRRTLFVHPKTQNSRASFQDYDWTTRHDEFVEFNGEEMKTAFKVLQNAGYYMFRIYEYGTWMGYKCSKKPFMEKGERVTEFNDFID
jgi:hypothetical protein